MSKRSLIRLSALFALSTLFLLPMAASAQERGPRRSPPTPEEMLERMEARLDAMKSELELSRQQETRIRRALRQGASEARTVLDQQPERGPERHEALRRVRWQTEDRVHAVLNCEQREQFRRLQRAHRAERHEQHRRHRRGRRGRRGGGQNPAPSADGGV